MASKGMNETVFDNLYGQPPDDLVAAAADFRQFSPLIPGAGDLLEVDPGTLENIVVLTPPGTHERRYTLALALRALKSGGKLVALAPNDKGGARIVGDLEHFGCASNESSKRHHRICVTCGKGENDAIARSLQEGAPRYVSEIGLWSQPGIFSWNRIDPGSALLLNRLPAFSGAGADLGCGIGLLAHGIFLSAKVTRLTLIDIDRRAVNAAQRNVADARAAFVWADARGISEPNGLDFVVMNPPFHEGSQENHALGQAFIQRAAAMLRPGGSCWLVANRHLPYEASLKPLFRQVDLVEQANGFKIYSARK